MATMQGYAQHPNPAMRPDFGRFRPLTVPELNGAKEVELNDMLAQDQSGQLVATVTTRDRIGEEKITTLLSPQQYQRLHDLQQDRQRERDRQQVPDRMDTGPG